MLLFLQCTVPDKEAILLHWLYKIPTSALVKPTQTKIVQVSIECCSSDGETKQFV